MIITVKNNPVIVYCLKYLNTFIKLYYILVTSNIENSLLLEKHNWWTLNVGKTVRYSCSGTGTYWVA